MKDKREFLGNWLLLIAFFLLLFDLYYFNYSLFKDFGLDSAFFERRVRSSRLPEKMLFRTPYLLRLMEAFCILTAIFLDKVKNKLDKKDNRTHFIYISLISTLAYTFIYALYYIEKTPPLFFIVVVVSLILFFVLIYAFAQVHKLLVTSLTKDRFGKEDRKFEQTKALLENEYSVNIPTGDGWINVVNPFRASVVLGTPGSGKSYCFLNEGIKQSIQKGYAMYVYDYKFDTLTEFAYNCLVRYGKGVPRNKYKKGYDVKPEFCVINFDDPERSNRCNPLQPDLLRDPTDAVESAKTILVAFNQSWVRKEGDYFVESPINFLAACIWALKLIEGGRYCSLPHIIQLVSQDYDSLFGLLTTVEDDSIKNIIEPFTSAWKSGATDQLEGQMSTVRNALARLTSKQIYWIMTTGDDEREANGISLDINNPERPKILCIGNNEDRKAIYGPCISLYNTRILKLINKKGKRKCALFIDELPTLSFSKGTIDNVIATGRSNKIAVWLGFQDFAQTTRDFGKEVAEAIINTVGNTFCGMVNYETAEKISKKMGKIKVQKENVSISSGNTSVSYSTQYEDLIPASEISQLPQGVFCGQIADTFEQPIEQKTFYSTVQIDAKERKYLEDIKVPKLADFGDKDVDEALDDNFRRIKEDIIQLIEKRVQRTQEEHAE